MYNWIGFHKGDRNGKRWKWLVYSGGGCLIVLGYENKSTFFWIAPFTTHFSVIRRVSLHKFDSTTSSSFCFRPINWFILFQTCFSLFQVYFPFLFQRYRKSVLKYRSIQSQLWTIIATHSPDLSYQIVVWHYSRLANGLRWEMYCFSSCSIDWMLALTDSLEVHSRSPLIGSALCAIGNSFVVEPVASFRIAQN